MRYVLVFVLVVILSFCGFLAYHLGALKSVTIGEQTKGPLLMVYKDFTGPYHKTVSVISEVEKWALEKGYDCHLSFGQYMDDPQSIEEARLKSRGGCLMDKLPPELPKDFKTQTIPEQKYVVAVFSGSPGIGPMKVYPKVAEFMTENKLQQKGAVIEVYEIHSRTEVDSMTTTYLFPL